MANDRTRRLRVFLRGVELGELERAGPTRYRLAYDPAAVARYGEGAVVLSASLPLREDPYPNAQTKPFFEGLLPEGVARREVARAVGVSESNGFGLLEAIGSDCAGAVVVVPAGAEGPGEGEVVWLTPEQVVERLRDLPNRPLGVDPVEGIRLSLGGVQQKLVVTRAPDGRIGQPRSGAASTHIIKPAQPGYDDIVANEAFGLRVARCAGLDAANAEILSFEDIETLTVERFDRAFAADGRIVRLHQEDMCQALGVLPAAKYESEGGPSFGQIAELLRAIGTARDLTAFARATLINFLLGNSDAHGKNFALLYADAAAVRLAPLYDIVSTAVYPGLTRQLAMTVAGEADPSNVTGDLWVEMLRQSGFRPQAGQLRRDIEQIVACSRETVERARAEGWHRALLDSIDAIVNERAQQLLGLRR